MQPTLPVQLRQIDLDEVNSRLLPDHATRTRINTQGLWFSVSSYDACYKMSFDLGVDLEMHLGTAALWISRFIRGAGRYSQLTLDYTPYSKIGIYDRIIRTLL